MEAIGMRKQVFSGLGQILPLNMISLAAGRAARLQLPAPLGKPVCSAFVKAFGIDMSEAERPLEEYATIEDVFTRKLKPGIRPIQGELVFPSDGILSVSGPANENSAVQAKGLDYSLAELMFGDDVPPDLYLGWFATIYLAPHNYHRVHSPIKGELKTIRYFPGQLWPVNKPSVRWTPSLFTRNERLVFDLETPDGCLYLAMVGALNVGRVTTPFLDDFTSNASRQQARQGPRTFELDRPHRIVPGQELGTFMLGSTVIIAFDEALAKRYRMDQALSSRPVRLGEPLK
jgi:phosphatidylserine decarboxylase